LDQMLAELAAAVIDTTAASDADRIERIARLEKLRAATAAVQAAESVRFAQSQVAEQLAAEVHPTTIGRGIAEQIGLACRISPVSAARRLNTARALWCELPDTYRQLRAGELSERVADSGRRNAAPRLRDPPPGRCPTPAGRYQQHGFPSSSRNCPQVRHQADPRGYVQRGRTERQHRRVGVRPAPDTMAVLTGYLPVEQGIACYAALRQHAGTAAATGDPRTRDQIMADTLVEPLTGQTTAADVNVELQLMMPLDSLINPADRSAAVIPGYGPLPQELAWGILTPHRLRLPHRTTQNHHHHTHRPPLPQPSTRPAVKMS
jgi:Domain of unknown function (DUF222)